MKKRNFPQKKVKNVFFLDSPHTYWYDENGVLVDGKRRVTKPGIIRQLDSVGSRYKKFLPEYDSDYWLTNGAIKALEEETLVKVRNGVYKPPAEEVFPVMFKIVKPEDFFKERGKLKEFWQFKGQNAAFLGTKLHRMLENQAKANGYVVNPWTGEVFNLIQWEKFYDNEAYPGELKDLPDGGYRELLVYDLELNVAGQLDLCFIKTIGGIRYASIGDDKSNEKKPPTTDMECFYEPLSHLNAGKHNQYAMQLSMYAYILERAGFEILEDEIGYSFYKNYEISSVEHINTPFLREECESIFNY